MRSSSGRAMSSVNKRMRLRWARVAGLGVVLGTFACSSGPPPPDTRPYEQQIQAWRTSKDEMFRSVAGDSPSPLPADQRASFPGLVYFPIDGDYHVPAALTLERSNPPRVMELPTSGPELRRRVEKVGTLGFSIKGSPYTLIAFADEGSLERLFVPFADLSNGGSTYRGGRYLELDRTSTGLYDLDFNRAYNPFCVYNTSYDCPIPPRENRLLVAILAGEKLPAGHGQ
jgi:uncharacterized protein